MGRLRSGVGIAVAVLSLLSIGSLLTVSGCGGHTPAGASPFPAKITITPGSAVSLQAGGAISFFASAQNASNGSVGASFTWQSSDTSIVNVAPNGVACAGHWDITNTVCTPGGIGVATVTATALGSISPPTYVFVHQQIDNIQVNGILLTNVPIQEPCLSAGQTMTVEARAFSQGADITSSIGPFTWTANNASVVKITPLVNNTGTPMYPFATNQATVAAVTPGITQIIANASGVASTTFYQPQFQNAQGDTSPLLDFFETCPIQSITLEVGPAGSQQSNQTSFVTAKGTPENATAVITDVMGNNSLPEANTTVTLSKIPLTWTALNPAVLSVPNGCTESCSLSTPLPGAGAVTASCSPPTCNIGFPEVPVALSTPANLAACASFFKLASCTPFIPVPVYSSPACSTQSGAPNPCPSPGEPPIPATISGLITGPTSATSALVSSTGCKNSNPLDCTVGMYNVSSNRDVAGNATPLPVPPNSLLFDLAGDKAYMGSEIAALAINPSNVGTGGNAFTSIGSVTGNVLAVSDNGALAIFSDPRFNEVFVVNAGTAAASTTTLNIANATAAGFAPDGIRAYIYGFDVNGNPNPNLYVYSPFQALQTIPLPANTTVNSIVFSTNGAFAYAVEPSPGGVSSVTVYNNCVHDVSSTALVAGTFNLTAPPVVFKALPDGIHFVALENNGTFDYITASITPPTLATITTPAASVCPMTVTHTVQNFNLDVGTIQGLNIFSSADGSLIYVLASNLGSVLVYDFGTGSPTRGIQLVGTGTTPVNGFMSPDAGTIVINGSDGNIHIVSTAAGGSDLNPPINFPNLPNYLNPFCTYPAAGCTLNLMALRP
jgi:hypothetical protein